MQGLGALSYKLSVLRACDAHQAQRRRFVRDWSAARSTGDRTRTYDLHHVKVLLYQLSYLRLEEWAGMDSNHRKQTLADLQSAPFDRSGTYP